MRAQRSCFGRVAGNFFSFQMCMRLLCGRMKMFCMCFAAFTGVWTRKYPGQIIFKIGWGEGYPHRPTFLTCMETTLKIGAIYMKFAQDVCMDEKIFWTKNFFNRSEGGGVPPIDLHF